MKDVKNIYMKLNLGKTHIKFYWNWNFISKNPNITMEDGILNI